MTSGSSSSESDEISSDDDDESIDKSDSDDEMVDPHELCASKAAQIIQGAWCRHRETKSERGILKSLRAVKHLQRNLQDILIKYNYNEDAHIFELEEGISPKDEIKHKRYVEDWLTKSLLTVDAVTTYGDEHVRAARRRYVRRAMSILDHVDRSLET